MDTMEDPSRQVGYLQQCLSNDKKPLALFIGAGCPTSIQVGTDGKSPLIPDIAGVSMSARQYLAADVNLAPLMKKIEEHLKKDGREGANIEVVLSHIRALRAVAGGDAVRGMSAQELDRLDDAICGHIFTIANKDLPSRDTPYHRVASWVDGIKRDCPIEIFTSNYDLLMEQALEESRISYFDGFAGSRHPFFDVRAMEEDVLPSRWARVWKLHGSINWFQDEKAGVIRGRADEAGLRRVIHPTHLKYDESRRMPYLAMMDRLRAFLRQPMATLLICGYSFKDEHINEIIVQGLQGTQTASAFGLLFGEIKDYGMAITAATSRANLSLLAKDGAVIGGRRVEWATRPSPAADAEGQKWIKWIPKQKDKPEGLSSAHFQLGDFAVLGDFLLEMLGEARHSTENQNGQ